MTNRFKGWRDVKEVEKTTIRKPGKTFFDYLRPEDILQHQVILWLKYTHPTLKYHHSPNEGRRTPFERFLYEYLGSDSGYPDLEFPSLLLIIELKVKPNRVQDSQREWLDYFKSIGWRSEVCWSYEEAVKTISEEIAKSKL